VEQWAAFGEAVGSFGDLPLYLDDSARTVADVASWSRRIHQERGLALVVVDYLQKLAPGSRGRSREEEVAVISSELTNLAKDLRVPVLALSQLARAPEDRKDKRPHLTDLRESGSLEQDAGLVLFLFREELHKPTAENAGLAEVIVGKNRNGPVGSLTLAFRKEFARFDNIVHEGI
jgi:replicative DNA helicase